MGCVVGSLASTVACCCGTAACHLCCACLPACKTSMATRLGFAVLLVSGAIASAIMLTPGLRDDLQKIPFLCDIAVFPNGTNVQSACDRIVGYEAVYRMCFALTCFFFIFAVIMINVKSSKDPRAKIQNGFWGIKFIILLGLIVGAFFIPYGEANEVNFAKVWMWFGMVGAVLFIIVQLVLLIDSVHSLNEKWSRFGEEYSSGRNRWNFLIAFCTVILYLATIGFTTFLYIYYGKQGCDTHIAFISVNLVLCLVVSTISELSIVKKRLPYSGVFPSSAVSLYATYVTWSGMSNNPDRYCNPNLLRHLFMSTSPSFNATSSNSTASAFENTPVPGVDPVTIVSIVIWFGSLAFSCFRSNRSETAARLSFSPSGSKAEPVVYSTCDDGNENRPGQKVLDDETEQTVYSYCLFHVMLMLSSTYIMMTLTNWFRLSPDLTTLNTNLPAMWVKIGTSWAVFVFYMWSLLAPMICPGRFQ